MQCIITGNLKCKLWNLISQQSVNIYIICLQCSIPRTDRDNLTHCSQKTFSHIQQICIISRRSRKQWQKPETFPWKSNFTLGHNVFKNCLLLLCQHVSASGKVLKQNITGNEDNLLHQQCFQHYRVSSLYSVWLTDSN